MSKRVESSRQPPGFPAYKPSCYRPSPVSNTKRSHRCTSSPTEGWCRVRLVHRTLSYVPLLSVIIITIVDLWG